MSILNNRRGRRKYDMNDSPNSDRWYQNRVPEQIAKLTARIGQVETDRLLATLTDAPAWKVYLTIQNKLIETDPLVGKEKT